MQPDITYFDGVVRRVERISAASRSVTVEINNKLGYNNKLEIVSDSLQLDDVVTIAISRKDCNTVTPKTLADIKKFAATVPCSNFERDDFLHTGTCKNCGFGKFEHANSARNAGIPETTLPEG